MESIIARCEARGLRLTEQRRVQRLGHSAAAGAGVIAKRGDPGDLADVQIAIAPITRRGRASLGNLPDLIKVAVSQNGAPGKPTSQR